MSGTGAFVSKVTSTAVRALLSKLPTEQQKIDRVRDEIYRDAVLEVEAALQRFVERYEREGVTAEKLAEKIDERAATVLFLQLFDQAVKSATRDRLRLMAAAIAGIFTPNLDLETKSRAARAIAQLEPSDVVMLRRLRADLRDGPKSYMHLGGVSYPALAGALCIMIEPPGVPSSPTGSVGRVVALTDVGPAVLEMVLTFENTDGWPDTD